METSRLTIPTTGRLRLWSQLPDALCRFLAAVIVLPPLSHAAVTNYVTTLDDSGPGSLRQSIADSQPGDSIRFSTNGIIKLTSGEIFVTNSVSIFGPGATNLAISGNNIVRIFNFVAGITSTVVGLTVRDGQTASGVSTNSISGNGADGGGLYNAGTVTLISCTIVSNKTGAGASGISGTDGAQPGVSGSDGTGAGAGGSGGAIYNEGTLRLSHCAIIGNATGAGGNGGNGGYGFGTNYPNNLGAPGNGGSGGDGGSGGPGGGVFNRGQLALNDCMLVGNVTGLGGLAGMGGNGGNATNFNGTTSTNAGSPGRAGSGGSGGNGGAVFSSGDLVITGSLFRANSTGSGNAGALSGMGGIRSGASREIIPSGPGGGGGGGGAIWSEGGTLVIDASTLSANSCGAGGAGGDDFLFPYGIGGPGGLGGNGGGIGNRQADVTLIGSAIFGNSSGNGGRGGVLVAAGGWGGSGGGIWNEQGALALVSSTISSNLSGNGEHGGFNHGAGGGGGSGGGIAHGGGFLTATACTLNANVCGNGGFSGSDSEGFNQSTGPGGSGGGIASPSTNAVSVLLNTLLVLNSSGIALTPTNLYGWAFRTNSAPGPDILGVFSSAGHNLIRIGNGSTGLVHGVNGDLVGTTNSPINPRLGPLQDNGGPTFTHALLAGSPAIDAGTNAGLLLDQRGQPRTIDNPDLPNSAGSDGTDIGAFEVNHILTATEIYPLNNDIILRFTSVSDKTYGVQYTPGTDQPTWLNLPGVVSGTGGFATYRDTNATSLPQRFYRIFSQP